jgi:hypothetical protein
MGCSSHLWNSSYSILVDYTDLCIRGTVLFEFGVGGIQVDEIGLICSLAPNDTDLD